MRHELERVAALKARVDAYNERLAAARRKSPRSAQAPRRPPPSSQSLTAARAASLATLKSRIGGWVERDQKPREAASRAEAEETVGRWLGGPYSIPTYIVMCESGGNYGAVNPSSGAGGAYQILPSTWALYGGQGEPAGRPEGRTGPDRRRNLGRLRLQRLGLRLAEVPGGVKRLVLFASSLSVGNPAPRKS